MQPGAGAGEGEGNRPECVTRNGGARHRRDVHQEREEVYVKYADELTLGRALEGRRAV